MGMLGPDSHVKNVLLWNLLWDLLWSKRFSKKFLRKSLLAWESTSSFKGILLVEKSLFHSMPKRFLKKISKKEIFGMRIGAPEPEPSYNLIQTSRGAEQIMSCPWQKWPVFQSDVFGPLTRSGVSAVVKWMGRRQKEVHARRCSQL